MDTINPIIWPCLLFFIIGIAVGILLTAIWPAVKR